MMIDDTGLTAAEDYIRLAQADGLSTKQVLGGCAAVAVNALLHHETTERRVLFEALVATIRSNAGLDAKEH